MAIDVVHKLVIRGAMPKSGYEDRLGTSLHVRNTLVWKRSVRRQGMNCIVKLSFYTDSRCVW